MASFAEAIQSSIVASMDPNAALTREAMAQYVDNQKADLVDRRATSIDKVEKLLAAAKSRSADASVIGAYQKLLDSLTS